jgi:gas vesicle protein
MAERSNDPGSFLKGLMIGGFFGAVAGLFFAPKSGRELRDALREKGSEAFDEAKQFYSETETKAKAILEDARRRAEELRREADRQLAEARQRAKEIIAGEGEGVSEAGSSKETES